MSISTSNPEDCKTIREGQIAVNKPTTRLESKHTGTSIIPLVMKEDRDTIEERAYLEKHLFLLHMYSIRVGCLAIS